MFCWHWVLTSSDESSTAIVSLKRNGNTTKAGEHTTEVERRALVEETKTHGTVLAAKQILEGASDLAATQILEDTSGVVAAESLVPHTAASVDLRHGRAL